MGSIAACDCPPYDADVQDDDGFPRPRHAEERHRLGLALPLAAVSRAKRAAAFCVDLDGRWEPRCLGASRPAEHLGARVYPDKFSLAQVHRAFGEDGQIADGQLRARFETTVVNFMDIVEASKHYPCVKSAWVEYLGERPEPAVDRVQ